MAGLVGFRFLPDSGLHVADTVTEAAAARDVDDAAPQTPRISHPDPTRPHALRVYLSGAFGLGSSVLAARGHSEYSPCAHPR